MSRSNEQLPPAPPEQIPDYPSSLLGQSKIEFGSDEVDPNNPPWNVLIAFGLWLLSILLVNFLPIFVVGPYLLIRYKGVPTTPQILFTDHTATLLFVLAIIPAHLLTFGAVWLVVTRLGKRPFWQSFGWSWGKRFGFWASAGVAFALYLLGSVVAKKLGGDQQTDIDLLIDTSTAVRIALAILAATTGPLVEELIYRGVLYAALQRAIGTIGTVIIVSFLFALVHVYQYKNNWGVIAVILMLSISLTLVRAWTGRLLPCFIIHMVFNGVQSLLILFHPYLEQFEKSVEQKTGIIIMLWRTFGAII